MKPLQRRSLRHSVLRPPAQAGRCNVGRLFCLLAMSGIVSCLVPSRDVAAQSSVPVSGSAVPGAPKLKADLNRILRGSEYQPESQDQNSVNATAKKFIKDIRKRWARFLKWLGDLFKIGGGLVGGGNAVTGVVVTLLIALLMWIVIRLSRDWKPKALAGQLFKNDPSSHEEGKADIIRDPEIWSQQGAEWAEKQDYRRAYRALFLAILLKMDAVSILSYDRGHANGDYLRQLRTHQNRDIYNILLPLAGSYDQFWYGRKTAQASDYATILEVYCALPTLLRNYAQLGSINRTSSILGSQPGFQPGKGQTP